MHKGEPLMVDDDERVWSDLPNLGSAFEFEWDGLTIPEKACPARKETIVRLIHFNQFAARLMATNLPVFDFSYNALDTMRSALETPLVDMPPTEPPEAMVPAAAKWISVVGRQIYDWHHSFGGDPKGLFGKAGRFGGTAELASVSNGGSFGGGDSGK